MAQELSNRTYSDLNPNPRAETSLVLGVESVYRALENYFGTNRGERLFRPNVGGSVDDWLWELALDDEGAFSLLSRMMSELPRVEPRVRVIPEKSTITAQPDYHRYIIYLTFKVLGEGDQEFIFDDYLINKKVT